MKKYIPVMVLVLVMCGVPPLQKAHLILQNGMKDESLVIQVNAAKGYALNNEPEGAQFLYETLRGDDKNGVVASLSALYDLGEKRYSPIIIELAQHDDPLIRAESYKLVAQIEDQRCYDVLVKGTMDKVAKIRKQAYLGLETFKDEKTIRKGLQDSDPIVKIAAATALGKLGDERASNMIRSEMQKINPEIWHDGLLALAAIKDTSAIEFIQEQLTDTPWEIRLAAAEALIILGQKNVMDVLTQGLSSSNPFTRTVVVRILKDHNIAESKNLLLHAAEDDYINVSILAIEALARYRAKEHANIFTALMDAPNPLVKIAAASAFLRSQ